MKAKQGDVVKIHFEGKLEEGQIIDSTIGDESYQMTIGDPENLPELENAIIGMGIGEIKEITLSPAKGYGEYDESLIIPVPRDSLPPEFSLEIGQEFVYQTESGEIKKVRLARKDDDNFFFDFNHPLAGKTVIYKIILAEIVS